MRVRGTAIGRDMTNNSVLCIQRMELMIEPEIHTETLNQNKK